jgi:hypothetical protein
VLNPFPINQKNGSNFVIQICCLAEFQNLHAARYELDKKLCPLAKLHNPKKIQVIILGTNSTLNFSPNF